MFDTTAIYIAMSELQDKGSSAAPGFRNPEGVICYHIAGNIGFKKTFEKDEEYKGKSKRK